jgi:hypothetical protein
VLEKLSSYQVPTPLFHFLPNFVEFQRILIPSVELWNIQTEKRKKIWFLPMDLRWTIGTLFCKKLVIGSSWLPNCNSFSPHLQGFKLDQDTSLNPQKGPFHMRYRWRWLNRSPSLTCLTNLSLSCLDPLARYLKNIIYFDMFKS